MNGILYLLRNVLSPYWQNIIAEAHRMETERLHARIDALKAENNALKYIINQDTAA